MAHGVKLKVWGNYACFTRPEMKAERVSYDVITPSAARGILEAVYWKPEIRWIIERILVLNPIRFTNIRRNELENVISVKKVNSVMSAGKGRLEVFIEDDRQQRAAFLLRDVAYVVEAQFALTDPSDTNSGKHKDTFVRRARAGKCYHRPYLGCREFPAHFELIEDDLPASALVGERDLGWMLHDLDFKNGMKPYFFRAVMRDGAVEVPPPGSGEIKR